MADNKKISEQIINVEAAGVALPGVASAATPGNTTGTLQSKKSTSTRRPVPAPDVDSFKSAEKLLSTPVKNKVSTPRASENSTIKELFGDRAHIILEMINEDDFFTGLDEISVAKAQQHASKISVKTSPVIKKQPVVLKQPIVADNVEKDFLNENSTLYYVYGKTASTVIDNAYICKIALLPRDKVSENSTLKELLGSSNAGKLIDKVNLILAARPQKLIVPVNTGIKVVKKSGEVRLINIDPLLGAPGLSKRLTQKVINPAPAQPVIKTAAPAQKVINPAPAPAQPVIKTAALNKTAKEKPKSFIDSISF